MAPLCKDNSILPDERGMRDIYRKRQQTCCKTTYHCQRTCREQNFHSVWRKISNENIGYTAVHMLSLFTEKLICPSVLASFSSGSYFNYKLTVSKSHGQTRLKHTQHWDKGFLQERQTNLGFTLTIRAAVSAAQTMRKTTSFLQPQLFLNAALHKLHIYG